MASLPPIISLPDLKSFPLTHILYDPSHPVYLSIPLTLLSLSPIFLFVSYFTLLIFSRRLTLLYLAIGQVGNECLSWGLKRLWKGDRPYKGLGEVGRGYGMPSSHAQAAGFLVVWGLGYWLSSNRRNASSGVVRERLMIKVWRERIHIFGLILWSLLVSYSR
jgi:dolichyldiphosphatase